MSGAVNYIPVAVPGGGVITITGNDGNAASADGGGNLNITGGAGINVDRIDANSLQITSAAVAAKFRANNGIDVEPNAENRVFLPGDGNVVTEADAAAHTITFSLGNDIDIDRNITAGNKIKCASFECLGPVEAQNCTIHNTLTVSAGAGNGIRAPRIDINEGGSTLADVLSITGRVLVNTSAQFVNRGVVTLTESGIPDFLLLQSSRGVDGQILIGAFTADPQWANITCPDGSIGITNGANSISLRVLGAPGLQIVPDIGGSISPNPTQININGVANQIVTRHTAANSMSIGFVGNPIFDAITVTGAATVGSLTTNGPIRTEDNIYCRHDVMAGGFVVHTVGPYYGACIWNNNRLLPSEATQQGQVLIGRPGAVPVWNRLTAGAGIAIDTSTPDQLTISATGGGGGLSYEFEAYAPLDRLRIMGITGEFYDFDNMAIEYDPSGVYDPVNGYFTAPATGRFFFTVRIGIARCLPYGVTWNNTPGITDVKMYLMNITRGISYNTSKFITAPCKANAVAPCSGTSEFTWELQLTIGDQVRPRLSIPGLWDADGVFQRTASRSWGIVKDITTFSGFKIG